MSQVQLHSSEGAWVRSPFRWAGSKKQLIPVLLAAAPEKFRTYVEPFAGSCCFFFALKPDMALLGDINGALMNAVEILRLHPRRLCRAVGKISSDSETYYQYRSMSPDDMSAFEQAVRFYYLNRYCFNGVYRINRKGQFNVPRGTKTGNPPTEAELYRCSVALRSAEFFCGDFEDCLARVGKNDFVYLDPPYAKDGDPKFGEYGYNCFKTCDLARLQAALARIDSVGAKFILSYEQCVDIEDIRNSWFCTEVRVRRHVAGFGANRRVVPEVLISNYQLNVIE